MEASAQQLEKLLNSALPKLFPDVKRVDVKEEELDQHTFYIHVFVVMDENTIPTIRHNPKYGSNREPNVKEMANLSNAAVATNEYADSASKAAKNMNDISNSTAMVADSMGSLSGGLSNLVSNLSASENETLKFKEEIAKLNSNLASLNTVYGNMLSAMGGGR